MLTRHVSANRGFDSHNPINKKSGPLAASSLHADLAPDSISIGATSGTFVPNLGQVDHDVYFQWIGGDVVAHFQADAVMLLARGRPPADVGPDAVRVRFVGAGRRPQVEASRQSPGRLTYPLGVRSLYSATIPLFTELTYAGLYDGVGLRFTASESGLVRSFTFAPGVAPSTVLMHFEGAGQPSISPTRDLEFRESALGLVYLRPTAYQEVGGVRTSVSADFEIRHFGAVGIVVAEFDPSLPLFVEITGV